MLEIYSGSLPTQTIYTSWETLAREQNIGAMCVFTGIVRAENNIQGLSFDIYEPLLHKWFQGWQEKHKAKILMAHSLGDVLCGESSFMCAILSSQRKDALQIYEDFIEDFKANAPIWKYDLVNNCRIYAKDRSKPLKGSGLLQ